jgi:TonB family protein
LRTGFLAFSFQAVIASILAATALALDAEEANAPGIVGLLEPDALSPAPGPGEMEYRVADGSGRPLPFASFRLVSSEGEEIRGRAYADGTFLARADILLIRAEISARGTSRVVDLRGETGPRRVFSLEGASAPALPPACDIVFIMDATASMKPYAEGMRRAIGRAGGALLADTRARFGFVFLGEREGQPVLDARPLSASAADFDSALGAFSASGGDDDAEPLEAALARAASGMAWEANAVKAVFLFTDAEAKDKGAHGAVKAARESGANIHVIALGNMPAEGEAYLRSVAAETRGAYVPAEAGRVPRSRGPSAVALPVEDIILRILRSDLEAAWIGRNPGKTGTDPALELLEEAQGRMASLLAYPEAARLRRASGVVTLALSVSADGSLAGAEISSSSGSAILDKAALALAKASFPIRNPSGAKAELFISIKYVLEPGEGKRPGSPEPAPPGP